MSFLSNIENRLDRIWPAKRHWHTHVQHALVALGIFGGNGILAGMVLGTMTPFMDAWLGFQLGGLTGCVFYLVREIGAHREYHKMLEAGELREGQFRLARWDSRLDVLVPWSVVLPVISYQWDLWEWWGILWAITLLHYIFRPKGQVFGMKA